MKCIFSHSTQPHFNLATEEYLLKHFDEDFFLFYRNDSSVVIGKHQNALAEVDVDFLEEKGIILARRISGGGAVYHDLGNVNYSFITNEKPGDYVRFATYTKPIIAALSQLGLDVKMGKRNELLLGDRKISGTASHVYRNRVIHHGTLLFNTDLEMLSKCLYVDSNHFNDKAVKSVRSEVVNLKAILNEKMDVDDFANFIFGFVSGTYFQGEDFSLKDSDIQEIEGLIAEKFSKWDWNYGYSPRYVVERNFRDLVVKTSVVKGRIENVDFDGEADGELLLLAERLQGERHNKSAVLRSLEGYEAGNAFLDFLF